MEVNYRLGQITSGVVVTTSRVYLSALLRDLVNFGRVDDQLEKVVGEEGGQYAKSDNRQQQPDNRLHNHIAGVQLAYQFVFFHRFMGFGTLLGFCVGTLRL